MWHLLPGCVEELQHAVTQMKMEQSLIFYSDGRWKMKVSGRVLRSGCDDALRSVCRQQ